MGRFYHSSDGILMLRVQNVWVEAMIISPNPILTEFVMVLVSCAHIGILNDFYNLPSQRMCLSWQTALALMTLGIRYLYVFPF